MNASGDGTDDAGGDGNGSGSGPVEEPPERSAFGIAWEAFKAHSGGGAPGNVGDFFQVKSMWPCQGDVIRRGVGSLPVQRFPEGDSGGSGGPWRWEGSLLFACGGAYAFPPWRELPFSGWGHRSVSGRRSQTCVLGFVSI